MITSTTVYFVGIADSIKEVAGAVALFSGIAATIGILISIAISFDNDLSLNTGSSELKTAKRFFRFSVFMIIICLILCTARAFVPSTKHACAIILIPKITSAIEENAELKELPSSVVDLARAWIVELSPKAEQMPKEKESK